MISTKPDPKTDLRQLDVGAINDLETLALEALGLAKRYTTKGTFKAAAKGLDAGVQRVGKGVDYVAREVGNQAAKAGRASWKAATAAGEKIGRGAEATAKAAAKGLVYAASPFIAAGAGITYGAIKTYEFAGRCAKYVGEQLKPLLAMLRAGANWTGTKLAELRDKIRAGLTTTINWLNTQLGRAKDYLLALPVVGPMLRACHTALKAVNDWVVQPAYRGTKAAAKAVGHAAVSAAKTVGAGVAHGAGVVRDALLTAIAATEVATLTAASFIYAHLPTLSLSGIYNGLVKAAEDLGAAMARIPANLRAAGTAIKEGFENLGPNIQAAARSAYTKAGNALAKADAAVRSFGRGTAKAWNEKVVPALKAAGNAVLAFAGAIASAAVSITQIRYRHLEAIVKGSYDLMVWIKEHTWGTNIEPKTRNALIKQTAGLAKRYQAALEVLPKDERFDATLDKGVKAVLKESGISKVFDGPVHRLATVETELGRDRPRLTPDDIIAILYQQQAAGASVLLAGGQELKEFTLPDDLNTAPSAATVKAMREIIDSEDYREAEHTAGAMAVSPTGFYEVATGESVA
jgi:hypothetical protein